MQFNFNCEEALGCDANGMAILEGSYQKHIMPGFTLFVNEILDRMGEASSRTQGLNTIITTAHKFYSSNHRIVIKAEKDKVLGFLKVGNKKLFLRDKYFNYHEVVPLCVLDFYVYETLQRKGIGRTLFDYMLNFEKKTPQELAYDRPSPKIISFLKKHFNLVDLVRQNNNFVVFNEFFDSLNGNSIKGNKMYDNATNRIIAGQRGTPINGIKGSPYLNKTTPTLSLSNAGQNLVYNNSFDNKIVNKNVYINPGTGFQSYYFNSNDTLSYDNIYSKQKIDLINDYLSTNKQEPYQYVKEQLGIKEQSIEKSNGRLNQLMNKIAPLLSSQKPNYDIMYNKRNQYATIFDDKKIVERNYYNQINQINQNNRINDNNYNERLDGKSRARSINGMERYQHYSPFSQYGKVYTNVLPTTSSAYGCYFRNQNELDPRSQSPNKIYY